MGLNSCRLVDDLLQADDADVTWVLASSSMSSSFGGHELVKRGIQEADGHGMALQRLDTWPRSRPAAYGRILASAALRLSTVSEHDHLADRLDTVGLEEHMLGTAQADALGAELDGLRGVARGVGVGADASAD